MGGDERLKTENSILELDLRSDSEKLEDLEEEMKGLKKAIASCPASCSSPKEWKEYPIIGKCKLSYRSDCMPSGDGFLCKGGQRGGKTLVQYDRVNATAFYCNNVITSGHNLPD